MVKDQIYARVKALSKIGGTEYGFSGKAAASKQQDPSSDEMAKKLDEYLMGHSRAAAAKSRRGSPSTSDEPEPVFR